MITDIFATWIQGRGSYTQSLRVYCGYRDVTAHICLSKVSGDSTASAYISDYCYGGGDVLYCPIPGGEGGSVQNFIPGAFSVTFALRLDDSFAYAPILLFFHN